MREQMQVHDAVRGADAAIDSRRLYEVKRRGDTGERCAEPLLTARL